LGSFEVVYIDIRALHPSHSHGRCPRHRQACRPDLARRRRTRRRALGERRIGHTGTLDPAASGVLPLVIGRATRLARFLSARDKSYDAVIRLGSSTDTGDAQGTAVGAPYAHVLPSREAIEEALGAFRGTHLQPPPAYSAKRIDGTRSYKLARARARSTQHVAPGTQHLAPGTQHPAPSVEHPALVLPVPVSVTAQAIDLLDLHGDTVTLRVDCSAGFYVRSLANDLGIRLGTGAHLVGLRRTRSGDFTLRDCVALDVLERDRDGALTRFVPLAGMLRGLPSVVLTVRARSTRATDAISTGRPGAGVIDAGSRGGHRDRRSGERTAGLRWIRLLDRDGALLGLARQAASRVLHPSVVLV
jgi:tRNA pseudouridine55 synthase